MNGKRMGWERLLFYLRHGDPVYEDERIESFYQVSEFRDCDFLIRVKGDSRSPHFTGGDRGSPV